jgi:hypothetical protein
MTKSFWRSRNGVFAILMIAAVSYFLLVEHREHLFQALPYLIILLCPLMHLFMHRGHGHHHSETKEAYLRGLKEGRKQAGDDSFSREGK